MKKKTKEGVEADLYIWKAVPPNNDFVALGMVATNSADEPSLMSLRCCYKGWLVRSTDTPVLIWSDAGKGGKKGSIWQLNKMGLLHVVEGHDCPSGEFFELKSDFFEASRPAHVDISTKRPSLTPDAPAVADAFATPEKDGAKADEAAVARRASDVEVAKRRASEVEAAKKAEQEAMQKAEQAAMARQRAAEADAATKKAAEVQVELSGCH